MPEVFLPIYEKTNDVLPVSYKYGKLCVRIILLYDDRLLSLCLFHHQNFVDVQRVACLGIVVNEWSDDLASTYII